MKEYFGREFFIGDFVLVEIGYICDALIVGKDEVYLGPSEKNKYGCVKSMPYVIKLDMTNANHEMQKRYNSIVSDYNFFNKRVIESNQTLKSLEPLTILLNDKEQPSLFLGYVKITYLPSDYVSKTYKGYCYIKLDELGITSKGALNSLLYNPISVNKLFSKYRKELKENKKFKSVYLSNTLSQNYTFKYSNTLVRLQGLDENFTKSYNLGLDKLIIDFVDLKKTV